MKKLVIMIMLFVIAGISVFGVPNTGDILSGSTTITATLESVLQIKNVTPFTDINLDINGDTKSIGSATFYTNRKNWSITVESANASNLRTGHGANTYNIPYTFTLRNVELGGKSY